MSHSRKSRDIIRSNWTKHFDLNKDFKEIYIHYDNVRKVERIEIQYTDAHHIKIHIKFSDVPNAETFQQQYKKELLQHRLPLPQDTMGICLDISLQRSFKRINEIQYFLNLIHQFDPLPLAWLNDLQKRLLTDPSKLCQIEKNPKLDVTDSLSRHGSPNQRPYHHDKMISQAKSKTLNPCEYFLSADKANLYRSPNPISWHSIFQLRQTYQDKKSQLNNSSSSSMLTPFPTDLIQIFELQQQKLDEQEKKISTNNEKISQSIIRISDLATTIASRRGHQIQELKYTPLETEKELTSTESLSNHQLTTPVELSILETYRNGHFEGALNMAIKYDQSRWNSYPLALKSIALECETRNEFHCAITVYSAMNYELCEREIPKFRERIAKKVEDQKILLTRKVEQTEMQQKTMRSQELHISMLERDVRLLEAAETKSLEQGYACPVNNSGMFSRSQKFSLPPIPGTKAIIKKSLTG